MTALTVGSLFSGYEGIGLGLSAAGIEHRHLWVCDNNEAASRVLAARLPSVPNLNDITEVDWRTIAVPDLLTGGFPCTDVSLAGLGLGITDGTRSGLWLVMARAISVLRPRFVLIENVRGLLSARAHSDVEPCPWCLGDRGGPDQEPVLRALGAVLGDLSDLGYDARWVTVPASAVGAPHERFRVFILAYREDPTPVLAPAVRSVWGGGVDALLSRLLPTARTSDTNGAGLHGSGGMDLRTAVSLLPTAKATDHKRNASPSELKRKSPALGAVTALLPTARASDGTKGGPGQRGSKGDLMLPSAVALLPTSVATDARGARNATSGRKAGSTHHDGWTLSDICYADRWGDYAPAIDRWERILGRPAPEPMVVGERGGRVLSHYFDEWFMGLPQGWITDVLNRVPAVNACGNGVVPQQLAYALHLLAGVRS